MKIKQWYIKLNSWEYWPMWILYIPVFFQHFYLSIKAKSLFFFLKVNPAIKEGFILSDRKYKTLGLVPEEHRPKACYIAKGTSMDKIRQLIAANHLSYPIIIKPNIGFRGVLVQRCMNEDELRNVNFKEASYLVQEYIDYSVEVGIFYYRYPNEAHGNIPSITLKEFLSITGDGRSTFSELIMANPRAFLQYERLKVKFLDKWNEVLDNGECFTLEVIGNHNRGTKFINGNAILDTSLLKTFDQLCSKMEGFYYGRFDIRAKSIEDLKRGENFKILEVNGVGAEPTHIYDPNYKLFDAWKEMLFLWRVTYQIAILNKKKGEEFPVFSEAKRRYLQYKNYKKVALSQ
ncbi:D-alanine--D-alanine ligase [Joostella sp.]|uniref:D-alanine--D-alanine ligase n=1 Tax=Joostella sp. TaxID=2231138 RepID=UPI003A8D0884